jgi:hypothetical protein
MKGGNFGKQQMNKFAELAQEHTSLKELKALRTQLTHVIQSVMHEGGDMRFTADGKRVAHAPSAKQQAVRTAFANAPRSKGKVIKGTRL